MGTEEKARIMVELEALGVKRRVALDRAAEHLTEIAALARDGLGEGLTKAEIAELAGVSRPTLNSLLAGGGV